MMRRVTLPRRIQRDARCAAAQASICESLEKRMLMAVQHTTALGDLVGREYLPDEALSKDSPSQHENVYTFRLANPAELDVQLSRLGLIGEDCDIFLRNAAGQTLASSTESGGTDEVLSTTFLAAGNYSLLVTNEDAANNAHYTLAIAADRAPFEVAEGGIGFVDGVGFSSRRSRTAMAASSRTRRISSAFLMAPTGLWEIQPTYCSLTSRSRA
jgi:hypothetical protein